MTSETTRLDAELISAMLATYERNKREADKANELLSDARRALYETLGVGHFIVGNRHIHVESQWTVRVDNCAAIQ